MIKCTIINVRRHNCVFTMVILLFMRASTKVIRENSEIVQNNFTPKPEEASNYKTDIYAINILGYGAMETSQTSILQYKYALYGTVDTFRELFNHRWNSCRSFSFIRSCSFSLTESSASLHFQI